MEISEITDSPVNALNPATAVETSEWNGKDVQALPQTRAWLVLQIPIQTPNPLPNLGQKITAVNSKTLPTVKDVLHRHGLEFGSRFYDREFEQLSNREYAWVVIPLNNSADLPSLSHRTVIDTNDYATIERVLERQGFSSPIAPYFSTGTLV